MRSLLTISVTFALVAGAPGPVRAQDSSAAVVVVGPAEGADSAGATQAGGQAEQIDELRRRIEILATELEQLRSGEVEEVDITETRRRALGLAPSAAATYRRKGQGVSFAGYGEMLLENFANESEAGAGGAPTTRLDFLRAVLYTGYRFNDKFLFN